MNAEDIKNICTKHGILFAARSYGQATTKTISLHAIEQIALDFYNLGLKDGVATIQHQNAIKSGIIKS